jgi:hypothetical protein
MGERMSIPKTETNENVHRFLEAPIVYFDSVPTVTIAGPVISLTLAATKFEMKNGQQLTHHVAVADLRMSAAAAEAVVAMIQKILLAVQPTPAPAN